MPFTLDPGYREHSTDRQWQILQAVEQYGGQRAAARALGVHQSMVCRTLSAVRAKAAQQGFAPEYDLTVPVAPGFFLKGTSTLYDMSTGEGRLQWVKTDRDREALEQMARDWVAGLSEEISRAPPLTQTEAGSADLLNLLVIADAHFGMLADEKETGADWNVEIAERTINRCFEDMLARAPAADEAVIAFLGDLSDINDIVPVTPKSGNVLDAERLGRVVPVVSRTVRRSVDMALRKHRRVHLKVMEGNHDRAVMLVMADGLKAYYENEPRVTVDDSGIPYYAHQFGRTMLAFHHGDMVKPPQIPITFASLFSEMWGGTVHRYAHTGDKHHVKFFKDEAGGMLVEQHATLAGKNAWAARNFPINAHRRARLTTYHREFGEVGGTYTTPEMLR